MIDKVLLLLPIVSIIGSIFLIVTTLNEKDNWSTDPNSEPEKINSRTSNRGMFVSIISALLLGGVGVALATIKVPDNMIVLNYGFILGPVISYLLDIGIGTDDGFSIFNKNKIEWIKYVFSSLISAEFLRYIVTVLLDLFISDPIQDVLRTQMDPIREKMKSEGGYAASVAESMPSIIQGIVGFVTFNAYTNQTRFNWAYPSENLLEKEKMSPYLVSLITAAMACVYLVHNKNAEDLGIKIFYVLFSIALLYIMNSLKINQSVKKSNEPELCNSKCMSEKNMKFIIAVITFLIILGYGLIWPIMNAGKATS